jgi:5'-3' exonuclease
VGGGPLVHLIDGAIYVFRAYYTLPSMEAPDGTPTGAAYGYANTLIKYVADQDPTHVAVGWDHSMESFRNEIFPDYKAQRGETPEDLEPQWEICQQVTEALGIPLFSRPDYEADDLIATLTAAAVKRGAEVRVVTTDKDLSQLVREDGKVALYNLAKDAHCDADGVRERFGVDPAQIPDFLGLVGDTVDNLPGVPGVGAKGAAAALQAFGRIEDIPPDPEKWKTVKVRGARRLAALIDEHRERALRTRALATVVREVPGVKGELRSMRYRGADRAKVETLFEKLGWGRIASRITRWAD